ncbi:DNA topology modulation protein [Paenibacillus marchantiophytorum]|uniref:DNA topology modulation protein n=1 Tax=Paenibacillus marchantiophytorum TaxID=1619310 RepID=A0ABQ1FJM0_9BACL|nr:AAA family ATPase [Paenibacillus marchantiophytorum]GGA14295.1 DNA topology modulation protein [Paenibacillus marchantiophytorum]
MVELDPKKIHIIGSVGSGKTTLARNLSNKLSIPHYELDNVVWKKHKPRDIKRTEEERDKLLRTIVHSNTWIIEGAHYNEWVFQSFHNADVIIFLDTDNSKRKYRIIRRFILQLLRIEKSNYKPTFEIFRNMFIWNNNFESRVKPKVINKLGQYSSKSITLKDTNEIISILNGERLFNIQ